MEFLRSYFRYIPYAILGGLCVFVVGVWMVVVAETPSGHVKVVMLNVGMGDSIYIESPTGEQVLIDSGPDDSVLRELPKVMPLFDHSLDAAIETHPDSDHISGFVDLLKRYHVGAFIEPGIIKDSKTAQTLESEILNGHIPRYIAQRGEVIDLGGGAVLQILYPDHDVSHLNQNIDNDGGVVTRLVYGSTSVMFMADVSQGVESRIIADSASSTNELKSDILKVGHHGSKTSTSEALLDLVRPQVALISVGAHNMYHLPTQDTLDRLNAAGVEVFRTDQVGTIEYESDGTHFWQVQ